MKYYESKKKIWDKINATKDIYIYGAQAMAYGTYLAIKELLNKDIKTYIVSCLENNPSNIDGIPVVLLNDKINKEGLIIIAVPEIYHCEIKGNLTAQGFKNYVCLNTYNEYIIMSEYYHKKTKFKVLEHLPLKTSKEKELDIKMYMAKHYKDKELKDEYDIPTWIEPIQVGAALTDIEIARLKDNEGNNISEKNPNYSELTAMYWVWKNRDDAYMGICHYRRMLVLDEKDISTIKENDINVVLPFPFICYPDTKGQYGRYISKEDEENMFQALKEISPDYYKESKRLLKGQYLYNYNMFLADKTTFNDFCSWYFPILEKAEELCEPNGIVRQDRYIGYLGEILTAIYFLVNKNNINIAHAEKRWMV